MVLENLLFRREQFPVPIGSIGSSGGKEYWAMGKVEIPPYHPSMKKTGIPFQLIPGIIEDVLKDTLEDINHVRKKCPWYTSPLENLKYEPGTKKIISGHKIRQTDEWMVVFNVPFIQYFCVRRNDITPYGFTIKDQGITIDPKGGTKSFTVPKETSFSEELMQEYEMKEEGGFSMQRRIVCPNLWNRDGLPDIIEIFLKNMVIGLDNAVVQRMYANNPTQ